MSCVINGYWSAESCNLINGFVFYGHYTDYNWAWGDYDSLGFNTLYVKVLEGDPTGLYEIWATPAGWQIRTGYTGPTYIFNDGIFRGGWAYIATPWIFNRCLFYNTDMYAISLWGGGGGSAANYCKFINCGHRGVYIADTASFTGYNNYFENVHLTLLMEKNGAYTVTWKNNSSKNLLAGFLENITATPTLVESNNQMHIDPNSTHGTKALAFGGSGRWATTDASDLPANTDTSLTTSVDSKTDPFGRPNADSPLLGAGTNLSLTPDYAGVIVPYFTGKYDIGAYGANWRFLGLNQTYRTLGGVLDPTQAGPVAR